MTGVLFKLVIWCIIILDGSFSVSSYDGPACSSEMKEVKKSELLGYTTLQNRINLMKAGVCFHSNFLTSEAMQIYEHIEKLFPHYAFVLVPKSLIPLKSGDPKTAILLLDEYFERVGGIHGTSLFGEDTDTNQKGPPCRIEAFHRLECVSALNYYGVAQMNCHNDTSALRHFERAMEIGTGISMVNDVYNNYAYLLSTMGHYHKAEEIFVHNFWLFNQNMEINIDPSSLIRRALLTPTTLSSIEEACKFKFVFEDRLKVLMELVEFGGGAWNNDFGELFKVADGISKIEDIRGIPVRKLKKSFGYPLRKKS